MSATSAGVSASASATSETNATASAAGASQSETNCDSYLTLTTEYKDTTYDYLLDVSGKWVEVMNSTTGMGGNITALQQLTTGIEYNDLMNMTTINNNVYVTDNLDVGGSFEVLDACTITGVLSLKDDIMLLNSVLITNAELQYLDNLSTNVQSFITSTAGNVTLLQKATTGISYTSATDITSIDNNVVISTGKSFTLTNGNFIVNNVTLTPTELSYLANVTSSIQTQLNTISGNVSTLQTATTGLSYTSLTDITSFDNHVTISTGKNFALINGTITINASTINETAIAGLAGYTGATIASRLTTLESSSGTASGALSGISYDTITDTTTVENNLTISTGKNFILTNGNFIVNGTSLSSTELSYLDNVTSNIQTQINSSNSNITNLQTATTNISYATSTTTINNHLVLSSTKNFTITNGTIAINTSIINETAIAGLVGYTGATIASRLTSLESSSGTSSGALTGISYTSATDTTTIDNNVTISTGKSLMLTNGSFIVNNGVTLTAAELSYIDGLTSNAQTQLTDLQTKTTWISKSGTETTINGTTKLDRLTTLVGDNTIYGNTDFSGGISSTVNFDIEAYFNDGLFIESTFYPSTSILTSTQTIYGPYKQIYILTSSGTTITLGSNGHRSGQIITIRKTTSGTSTIKVDSGGLYHTIGYGNVGPSPGNSLGITITYTISLIYYSSAWYSLYDN